MNLYKLRHIIKKGEGPKVDFKATIKLATDSEKKELARDVIAIANTRGGRGYLIFGIDDKTKKVIGVNPENYVEEKLQQIIYHRCDPPVPISIEFIKIDGKIVAIMTVYNSNHQPHQMIQNGALFAERLTMIQQEASWQICATKMDMTFETVILKLANYPIWIWI